MWDWSKNNLKPDVSSLYQKYADNNSFSLEKKNKNILSPSDIQNILNQELTKLNLHNIQLRQCNYIPHNWKEMIKYFNTYQNIRKKFLKLLGYTYKEKCLDYGFSDKDIENLKNGICPENHNTHIKIPFDFGGNINFDNLCLIKTHPLHAQIHSLIEFQIGLGFLQQHKIIYIPWIEGYLYDE